MTHASLFSGIGGFDLAAQWMGWDNLFHCEINPFCNKILNFYWPKAMHYEDIRKTNFTFWRGRIDVLTGGFPCQPYSNAGKRLGNNDERHLWPEMLRAIREIEPRWIVGENVRGLISWNAGMVFDEVQSDLENIGYQITPFVLPACGIDAPHKRERVWFIANRTNSGFESLCKSEKRSDRSYNATNPNRWKWHALKFKNNRCATGKRSTRLLYSKFNATNTHITSTKHKVQTRRYMPSSVTITNTPGIRLWRQDYRHRETTKFNEYFAQNDWTNFPTQSAVCFGDDGLSTRLDNITFRKWQKESIKGGGNAVVPQIPFIIFQTINEYIKLNK